GIGAAQIPFAYILVHLPNTDVMPSRGLNKLSIKSKFQFFFSKFIQVLWFTKCKQQESKQNIYKEIMTVYICL
ncbi:MAG: hypothetical protein N0E48_16175, partial [Candidatus Thiodiazotropha endolucinida]|nr:hypothetical protein [Candidatus Thiodiazotropha taylori]MCW4344869.1 hypothetical protein [Candidatus Thiodiazotropha endolucinida]